MNQATKSDEWQGDCVITWQAEDNIIVLDFQDLRQKKLAGLRKLSPGFEQQSRDWISSLVSTINALQEYLRTFGFDTIGQGEDFTILVKLNIHYINLTVPDVIERVARFLETRADIIVDRSSLSVV
jgi:hypothetical protein